MTDVLAAGQAADEAPVPQAPALTAAQIEELVNRKAEEKANAIADKRIAGLMSANDKKVAALEASLRKLQRTFSDGDDDGVDPRIADLEAELARVQREAQDAEYARTYPDVYGDWKALNAVDDDAARFEYLRKLKVPVEAAPPQEDIQDEIPEVPTPPVHPNQPARTPRGWVPGTAMDPATADAFFKGLTEWPT